MEIPQNILDKFLVRADYLEWIEAQQSIYVYFDFTNMLHWQDRLGWKFRFEDLMTQLLSYPNIKEVKLYYGENPRDELNSKAFHSRLRKTGAIVRSKQMKFLQRHIHEGLFFQRNTLATFDDTISASIVTVVQQIKESGLVIEEPKCNFDVEMTMDLLDDTDKMTSVLLFSGDSDMQAPLERLKIKGKSIGIVGVRGHVSTELHAIKDKYIDFGKFYTGKRTYKSENPAD